MKAALLLLALGQAAPPFTEIELSAGEEAVVELADGSRCRVKLVEVRESRDGVRGAVRRAGVRVEVNGEAASLVSGNYRLPAKLGGVQVDCPVTRGLLENGRYEAWGLRKGARLRLWPAGSSWFGRGAFVYPLRQRWFGSDTQMANEPSFVDGGERPGKGKIYYHYGLDLGGCEGMTEVVSATDGRIVVVGKEILAGHAGTPNGPRYDTVTVEDGRGWFYQYIHLKSFAPGLRPGDRVKAGQAIGVLGKEGSSGGWAHLHFDISRRDASGAWRVQEGYAFLWEAYRREFAPPVVAVARPHQVAWTGEPVELDGSRSWGHGLRHEWRLSDGTAASGPRRERRYGRAGTYSEVLKVTDGEGAVDFDFCVVRVLDRDRPGALPATIHAASAPTFGVKPGDPVTFKVRTFGTTEGEETWDFGDGTPPVGVRSDGGARELAEDGYASAAHRFAAPGVYLVRVGRMNATAHLKVFVGR